MLQEEMTQEVSQKIDERINNPVQVAKELYFVRLQIRQLRKMIDTLELENPTQSEYEYKLALKIAEISDTRTVEIEGKTYRNIPANAVEKIAKGLVAKQEGYRHELREQRLKVLKLKLKALESELSALQSIIKYVDEVE
ncbi:MAG: hypothetical protein H0Z24_06705 [Thermosipho sp. (in: Bacteria)]|nr:hypothetical protein [Thermosipho sp. (in: thermotogales)]